MEPTFWNVAILFGVFVFGYFFNDMVSMLWDSKPMTKEQYDEEKRKFEEASLGHIHSPKKKE
jgi:hypothetical protein